MAGWKYAKVTGTLSKTSKTAEQYEADTKGLLSRIADAVASAGWTRDARFADGPKVIYGSGETVYYATVLENSVGAKLLLVYGCAAPTIALFESRIFTADEMFDGTSGRPAGLMVSMIPPGSDEDFTFADGADKACSIPPSATRIYATTTTTSNQGKSFAYYYSSAAHTFAYHFVTKGSTLAVFVECGGWDAGRRAGFVVGEIFGTLAHAADSCRFGVLVLANPTNPTEWSSPGTTYTINYETSLFSRPLYTSSGYPYMRMRCSKGNHIPKENCVYGHDEGQLDSSICSCQDGLTRYVPMWAAYASDKPLENGIVPGDGFKGYISTDVIRMVRRNTFTRGQILDGGNFVYLGGGVCLGWDASITGSIF